MILVYVENLLLRLACAHISAREKLIANNVIVMPLTMYRRFCWGFRIKTKAFMAEKSREKFFFLHSCCESSSSRSTYR